MQVQQPRVVAVHDALVGDKLAEAALLGAQLAVEQALQAVNPSIAAPYWDFTVESTFYGASDWRTSFIFLSSKPGTSHGGASGIVLPYAR